MSELGQYLQELKSGKAYNDFAAGIDGLRQSSNDLRREFQSIVDKYPNSAYTHCIKMLEQEAKLLDMLQDMSKHAYWLASIVIEMRLEKEKTSAKPAKKKQRRVHGSYRRATHAH